MNFTAHRAGFSQSPSRQFFLLHYVKRLHDHTHNHHGLPGIPKDGKVVLLKNSKTGAKVYLVGTDHSTQESVRTVRKVTIYSSSISLPENESFLGLGVVFVSLFTVSASVLGSCVGVNKCTVIQILTVLREPSITSLRSGYYRRSHSMTLLMSLNINKDSVVHTKHVNFDIHENDKSRKKRRVGFVQHPNSYICQGRTAHL